MTKNLDRLRELLAYYGSLDKTTVLALINRAEAAEHEATAAKSVLAQHITERSLELHRTAGLAVDTAVEAVVKLLVDDPDKRARESESRAEAAERALGFHTQRDRELKTLLSMLSDRLDEFCYDELSSLIDDEPLNQWSETYKSKLQAAEESHRLANVMLRTVLEEMGSGPETDPIIKVRQLVARAEAAEAAVQRVREMHKPTPARYYGTDLNPQRRNDCAACGEGTAWPCATIRTLDGGEQA